MWLHLTGQLSLENLSFRHTCAGTINKIAVSYLGRPHLVRGQASECNVSIFKLAKFVEHRIPRYQSRENIASMTSLGILQKPQWLHQHSRYQWKFSFFRTNCPTELVPFHLLQTCLWFLLLLPLLVVVVPNSTLQRRWTLTTFSTFNDTR